MISQYIEQYKLTIKIMQVELMNVTTKFILSKKIPNL